MLIYIKSEQAEKIVNNNEKIIFSPDCVIKKVIKLIIQPARTPNQLIMRFHFVLATKDIANKLIKFIKKNPQYVPILPKNFIQNTIVNKPAIDDKVVIFISSVPMELA